MFKTSFDFVFNTLNEKRVNLLSYKNINSFAGFKLDDAAAMQMIQDIDDFLETVKDMLRKGDVYIEMHNNADEPRNEAGIDLKYIKLLDHNHGSEKSYFVMTAVNAEKLNLVDLHNVNVYKAGDVLFVCEVHYMPLTKGYILFRPAVFNKN